ncbi:pro-adrenomedullin-like [Betta splendens]|uniref:Pro-adrenomedullin-like n=1 Tax=Betta splendens TaxID=158456 RepID=A0A6P7MV84_BETSP|nr:pro-adrenomedullin-like [Betta splendens]
MRLVLHTVVCCCLITTVLPLKGDELTSSLKKRFQIWLQSHVKRDLSSSAAAAAAAATAADRLPGVHVGAQQDKEAPAPRAKRSASTKANGCKLGTCVYQDLMHEIYKINNKPKDAKAPLGKIGPCGYGRRRREAARLLWRHKRTCAVV